jgi:hypothetical protein
MCVLLSFTHSLPPFATRSLMLVMCWTGSAAVVKIWGRGCVARFGARALHEATPLLQGPLVTA